MDLGPILEALGVKGSLASITLEELQHKVNSVRHGILSRHQVLQIFMGWLHERIVRDIQQKSLLVKFVDVLLVPGKLHQEPFNEGEVDEAFKEWQANDATENPANIRRYQMVQLDFLELFERAKRGSNSEPGWSFGPSGFDREQDSSTSTEGCSSTRLVGGGKRKSGSNIIPLGERKRIRRNTYAKTAGTAEENEKGVSAEVNLENPSDPSTRPEPHTLDATMAPNGSPFASSPPPSYICNRCHRPGHWIQLCPTNLDPKWDRPPPPNYMCEICHKKGQHFATLCPYNKKVSSLTKLRQLQEKRPQAQLKTPTRKVKKRSLDRDRLTPPSRHRSRSPRDASHQWSDSYRPDDDPWVLSNDRDNHRRFRDRTASPSAARLRIGLGEDHSHEKSSGNNRHEPPHTPPRELPYRRSKAPPPQGHSRLSLRLNEVQKGEIGRLSYDDVFMSLDSSSPSPKGQAFSHKPEVVSGASNTKSEVMKHALVDKSQPKETEKATVEANKFLDEVTEELFPDLPNKANLLSRDAYVKDTEDHTGDEIIISRKKVRFVFDEDTITSPKTSHDSQGLKSGLEILALLKSRENSFIRRKVNRKTAAEMFDELDKRENQLP